MPCVEYEDLAMFCDECIAMIEKLDDHVQTSDFKDKLCDKCKDVNEGYCAVCMSNTPSNSFVIENGCFSCRQPSMDVPRIAFHVSETDKYYTRDELKELVKGDKALSSWIDNAVVGHNLTDSMTKITVVCVDIESIFFHVYK